MTTTDTNVQNLIINTMTKATYDSITPSATELYLITDESPITSSDVITALGYTPYNSTNPSGYISGITSSDVTTALGYTPYSSSNPNGYISGITSSMVTTALGYTPENSTNKVTSISSSSTDTQYPSAKAVWDNTLHSVSYDATTQTLTIT